MKKPKRVNVPISITVPPAILEMARKRARATFGNLSAYIAYLLMEDSKHRERMQPPEPQQYYIDPKRLLPEVEQLAPLAGFGEFVERYKLRIYEPTYEGDPWQLMQLLSHGQRNVFEAPTLPEAYAKAKEALQ